GSSRRSRRCERKAEPAHTGIAETEATPTPDSDPRQQKPAPRWDIPFEVRVSGVSGKTRERAYFFASSALSSAQLLASVQASPAALPAESPASPSLSPASLPRTS